MSVNLAVLWCFNDLVARHSSIVFASHQSFLLPFRLSLGSFVLNLFDRFKSAQIECNAKPVLFMFVILLVNGIAWNSSIYAGCECWLCAIRFVRIVHFYRNDTISAIFRSIIIHYIHSSLYSIFSFIAIIAPAPAPFNQFQQINIFNSIYLNFERVTAAWFLFRAIHGGTADSILLCISIAIFFSYLRFIWSPVLSWDVHNVDVVRASHILLYSISFDLRDSSWSPIHTQYSCRCDRSKWQKSN